MGFLAGKTALVTGASSGLGHRFAVVLGRQEKKIMEVIPGETVFGAHPAVFRSVAGEKPARTGDEIAVPACREIRNHMNIEVIDAFADVLPALAAIEAAHNPAVLETEIQSPRIIRMNMNIANMAMMRRLRIPPVLANRLRHAF